MSNDHHDHQKEIDQATGVETTGHEWDGLKELNNPLPRWWVWVWLITIVWSIWYFVVYPAWPVPGGATAGTSGYTQYKELEESQAEIFTRQDAYLQRFEKASFEEIMQDEELYRFALAGGKAAFKDNCATCHGTGAEGGKGYPNLNDDDWVWGGKISDIHQTLRYGIRADNLDTRISQMPAFGKDKLLNSADINAVVDYVLSLSGQNKAQAHHDTGAGGHDPVAALEHGGKIFQQQCASCHGADAKGLHEFGAPDLTDAIWLYGGDRKTVFETVYYARAGMMPAWEGRLDANTIRQLAVYIHELGGGEAPAPDDDVRNPEPLESPEYEKTQNLDALGDEATPPQPAAPVAQEVKDNLEGGADAAQKDVQREPDNLLEGTQHE